MPNRQIRVTRQQLAMVCRDDPELIRAFEEIIQSSGGAAWTLLDFSSSDLKDIVLRLHDDLQAIGEADETSSNATKNKHVSNNQLKVAYDDIAANLKSIKTNRVLTWLSM